MIAGGGANYTLECGMHLKNEEKEGRPITVAAKRAQKKRRARGKLDPEQGERGNRRKIAPNRKCFHPISDEKRGSSRVKTWEVVYGKRSDGGRKRRRCPGEEGFQAGGSKGNDKKGANAAGDSVTIGLPREDPVRDWDKEKSVLRKRRSAGARVVPSSPDTKCGHHSRKGNVRGKEGHANSSGERERIYS